MNNNSIKIILLTGLSVFFVFYFISNAVAISKSNKKTVLGTSESAKTTQGLPLKLVIPAININANVQNVGVTEKGDMDTPNNIYDVAWYNLGPKPGEIGSSVIAGHLDGKNNEDGVFFNLYKLKKGDEVQVKNDNGTILTFIVKKISTFDEGYAEDVFSSNDTAHLNLITCAGTWDKNKKSFNKRLVVFTDIKI